MADALRRQIPCWPQRRSFASYPSRRRRIIAPYEQLSFLCICFLDTVSYKNTSRVSTLSTFLLESTDAVQMMAWDKRKAGCCFTYSWKLPTFRMRNTSILLLQILLPPAFPAAESLRFAELTPIFTACVVHICAVTLASVCTCGSQRYLSLLLSILFLIVVKRHNQAQK